MSPRLVIEGQLIRPRFRLELALDLDLSTALGVLGPTGAGKTTLLRLIAGLEPHFTGLIQFDGETWSEFDRPDLVPTHRRQLGVVFQDGRLLPSRTVQANLDFAMQRARETDSTLTCESIVTQLGLEHLLGQMVEALSGGEKQRVAMARALLTRPRLLLMDEPLSANDPTHRRQALDQLSQWVAAEALPLIYVSHAVEELQQLTSQAILLDQGKVVGCGATDALMASYGEAGNALPGHPTSGGADALSQGPISRAVVLEKNTGANSATIQWSEDNPYHLDTLKPGDRLAVRVEGRPSGFSAPLKPESGENKDEPS